MLSAVHLNGFTGLHIEIAALLSQVYQFNTFSGSKCQWIFWQSEVAQTSGCGFDTVVAWDFCFGDSKLAGCHCSWQREGDQRTPGDPLLGTTLSGIGIGVWFYRPKVMVHSCSQIFNLLWCIESRCFNVHHGWMYSQDGTTMCLCFGLVGVLEAALCWHQPTRSVLSWLILIAKIIFEQIVGVYWI